MFFQAFHDFWEPNVVYLLEQYRSYEIMDRFKGVTYRKEWDDFYDKVPTFLFCTDPYATFMAVDSFFMIEDINA